MKKIRALVVHEIPAARAALREMIAFEKDMVLLGEYENAPSAVRAIRKHRPQILFLGVQLRGSDGFDVLKSTNGNLPPAIVFVAKSRSHAVRAFGSHAVDYLVTPFSRERFVRALTRARARLESLLQPDRKVRNTGALQRLGVKVNGRTVLLRPEEIETVVASRTYSTIRAAGEMHRARSSLSAFHAKLPPGKFIRINRSTLINSDHVETVIRKTHGDGLLRLTNGKEFPLSRRYRRHWAALIGP